VYLSSELGSTYLSEVTDVELLAPSYAIGLPKENPPGNTCAPMFFRSWQARGLQLGESATRETYDFKLASIAREYIANQRHNRTKRCLTADAIITRGAILIEGYGLRKSSGSLTGSLRRLL
jgi:hypothetical protein